MMQKEGATDRESGDSKKKPKLQYVMPRLSPQSIINLKVIASLIYQVYITIVIKVWPAENTGHDIEFVVKEKKRRTSDDDSDDENIPEYEIKYIGMRLLWNIIFYRRPDFKARLR